MGRLSHAGVALAAAALLAPAPAGAQEQQPWAPRCRAYADNARLLGYLQELGAKLPRVSRELATTPPSTMGGFTAEQLQRLAGLVWTHRLKRDDAELWAFRRCMDRLGQIEKDS